MAKFAGYHKYVVFGFGAVAGGSLIEISRNYYHTHIAQASWTTNYEPSGVKWDSNWDRREGEFMENPKKRSVIADLDLLKGTKDEKANKTKSVRNIIMIRHGQYNLDGKTDKERVLTALGRTQANSTGERLNVLNLPFNKIYVSTMSRAIETASLISKNLPGVPVEQCALLEEGAPVPPDPPVGHWKPEVYQFFQDGPRIEAAFRNFFFRANPDQERDSYELLVCHANVIRYFVCRAMQFPGEAWLRFSLYHASITWLQIYPNGRVTLRIYGDVGHMSPDRMTILNYSAIKPEY